MQNSQQNAAATNASLPKTVKSNSANSSATNVAVKYQTVAKKGVYLKALHLCGELAMKIVSVKHKYHMHCMV